MMGGSLYSSHQQQQAVHPNGNMDMPPTNSLMGAFSAPSPASGPYHHQQHQHHQQQQQQFSHQQQMLLQQQQQQLQMLQQQQLHQHQQHHLLSAPSTPAAASSMFAASTINTPHAGSVHLPSSMGSPAFSQSMFGSPYASTKSYVAGPKTMASGGPLSSPSYTMGTTTAGSIVMNSPVNVQQSQQPLLQQAAVMDQDQQQQSVDAHLQNLRNAAKVLDEKINHDRLFPDLRKLFSQPHSHLYSPLPVPALQLLQRKKVIPLPDQLFDQFDDLQCKCFMGVFPEINRVWVTIDNKLFLWNFEDEEDFVTYDDTDQVIVSVGLATPKPGVFVENIEYLLVVATPIDITILGLSFDKRLGTTSLSNLTPSLNRTGLQLYATQLTIPADNITMMQIVGMGNGRIFMVGNNGQIYELEYHDTEGWFQRKCQKINRTRSAAWWMPSFVSMFTPVDNIVRIAIDEQRHFLYALTANSSILVFDLGEDGLGFSDRKVAYTTLRSDYLAKRNAAYGNSMEDLANVTSLVSIHVVSVMESDTVCLVAVSADGTRFYFAYQQTRAFFDPAGNSGNVASPVDQAQHTTIDSLVLVHIREAPQSVSPESITQDNRVHASHYSSGLYLAVRPVSDDADVIVGSSMEAGLTYRSVSNPLMPSAGPAAPTAPYGYAPGYQRPLNPYNASPDGILIESTGTMAAEGKTWSVTETPSVYTGHDMERNLRPFSVNDVANIIKTQGSSMNELGWQLKTPNRNVVVLTNAGVVVATKLRPIDVISKVLADVRLQGFWPNCVQVYGEDEVASMCLAIACKHPFATMLADGSSAAAAASASVLTSPKQMANVDVIATAKRFFFEKSTQPRFVSTSVPSTDALGQVQSTSRLETSSRHNGFALYLSRLINGIWKKTLLTSRKQEGGREKFDLVVKSRELREVQQNLLGLVSFLEQNPHFSAPPRPSDMETAKTFSSGVMDGQVNVQALQMEQQSLYNLHQLLLQVIEAISFVQVMVDRGLSEVVSGLKAEEKVKLLSLTYENLITLESGRGIVRALITSIVNKDIRDQRELQQTTEELRKRCPSFFSSDDVLLHKATECLERARRLPTPLERERELIQSLKYFKKVASIITIDKLSDIVTKYMDLSLMFHASAVDLALECARRADERYDGVAVAEGLHEEAELVPSELRRQIYDLITHILTSVNTLLTNVKTGAVVGGTGAERLTPQSVEALRLHVMDKALSSDDKLFHFHLYSWLVSQNMTQQLLEIKSPFLEEFLNLHKADLEAAELLWKYYVRQNEFGKAAHVQYQIAMTADYPIDLIKRNDMLSNALANIKCAGGFISGGDDFEREVQDQLDVVRVQLEVYRSLETLLAENAVEYPEDVMVGMEYLDRNLLDVTELYEGFTRKYRLYEVSLLIFRVANYQDKGKIKDTWRKLINLTAESAAAKGVSPWIALQGKVLELTRSLYPNANVFPVREVVNLLESWSIDHAEEGSQGWVFRTLREGGVPFFEIFQAYHELFETKIAPWSDSAHLLHLLGQISLLVEQYVKFMDMPTVDRRERENFDYRAIDDALKKYVITDLGRDGEVLVRRFRDIGRYLESKF